MIEFIKRNIWLLDIFLVAFVCPAAWLLKNIRKAGVQRLPLCKKVLLEIGVFPIRNHYYEPQFDMREIKKPFSEDRNLPGIEWNVQEQLNLLNGMAATEELVKFPEEKTDRHTFYFNNDSFKSGDAEFWYQLIRLKKPRRIFEVGSGNSTLMARQAIQKNQDENPAYQCQHQCIEPYEAGWLEEIGVNVVRDKVENIGTDAFAELQENDILFIDSSHIIRPEGDVLFEYLELLPVLSKGVIVHVHDIFSPKNYLQEWLCSDVRFWNEQYLLEAFLTCNKSWKIIGALNFLHHHHYEKLKNVCPFLTSDREPGSFYIQKTE